MRLWYRMIFVGTVTAFAGGCLGEFTEIETPPVENLALRSVSVGGFHACSVADDGNVYCWGLNSAGQLGDLTFRNKAGPVRVGAGNLTFKAVTAGGGHTCAVTPTGDAYCWGLSTSGQVGDGGPIGSRPSPVQVIGNLEFVLVSAGGAHTCGVTVGGDAYCWGDATSGQLGIGPTSSSSAPVMVPVPAGELPDFMAVSTGGSHTCAVLFQAARCWGLNDAGQLGDATTQTRESPVEVTGGVGFSVISAALAPFAAFTCGITGGDIVYCWGSGASGQLGNGATDNQSAPVRVSGQG